MTVAITARYQNFNGSGTTGPFTFSFPIVINDDGTPQIVVTKISAGGVNTVLNLPADFSFTAIQLGKGGGSITTTVAIAVGERLFVEADTQLVQATNFANQGDFFPESHERAFDKIYYILQENQGQYNTAIRIPSTDVTGTNTTLPAAAQRAGQALVFDGSGNAAVGSIPSVTIPSYSGQNYKVLRVNSSGAAYELSSTLNNLNLQNCTANTPVITDSDTSLATTAFAQAVAALRIKNIAVRDITTSTTYTPTAGMMFALVRFLGAGGGGAGATSGGGQVGVGSGGGAGGYAEKLFTAAQIGASQSVTIAAGAAGGAAAANGSNAGASTFGSLLTVNGGVGGVAANSQVNAFTLGGVGGTATGGDINKQGNQGGLAIGNFGQTGHSGFGADSIWGAGGQPQWQGAGGNATGYGAGGAGGATYGAQNQAGGSGTAARCLIIEFIGG